MLGRLSISRYSPARKSENASSADNQQGSRSADGGVDPSETTRQPLGGSSSAVRREVARAYLLGALGDGTFNRLHRTFRFTQKEREWLEVLRRLLSVLGHRAWIYREGKARLVYALETSAKSLHEDRGALWCKTLSEQQAYVRGYFDAEGGIPQNPDAPLYVQFVQKDWESLAQVKGILERCGVTCGVIHNPSRRVDPEYWRFFVRRSAHQRFIRVVGSWHPRKAKLLQQRVKI